MGEEGIILYQNAKKSKFHNVASHPTLFQCRETIEWIMKCIYGRDMTIQYRHGEDIASFKYPYIPKYIKFPIYQVAPMEIQYTNFALISGDILKHWRQDANKCKTKADGIYKTKLLRKVYQLIMTMCC